MVQNDLKRLCRRLQYEFKHLNLLKQALTHCSVGNVNNERLEFLGDSILSFVIANALFELFPNESEGQLSRLRSFLVRGECLAEIALEIDLGNHLFLGQGELKSGGFRRSSILADALEAVFAAVFLDTGIEAASQVILNLYKSRLNIAELSNTLKDNKTQLQEFLQAIKMPLPSYELVKVEGEEHNQIFHIHCMILGVTNTTDGAGSNRRKAEQYAAKKMLEILKSKSKN